MDYQSPTETIKRVGIYLRTAMPLEQKRLINHLQSLEACRYQLAEATVKWHMELAEYKNRMLHPKDKELTELDRTTMLDAHVGIVRKDYEFLCKLEELVKDRLDFGRQLLTLI